VSVQGVGSVGYHLCRYLHAAGVELVVSDINPNNAHRACHDFNAHAVSPDHIYDQDVDLYAPCALGATLNDSTIARLKSTMIVGAANNQLAAAHHASDYLNNLLFYNIKMNPSHHMRTVLIFTCNAKQNPLYKIQHLKITLTFNSSLEKVYRMKLTFRQSLFAAVAAAIGFTGAAATDVNAEEVNIYSYRKEALISPLLERFTAQTGIDVNLVNAKADALLERLKNEGANSPADVLLTVDVGRLIRAEQAGVLQAVESETLNSLIPSRYRDPEGNWYGLSLRSRVIYTAKDRVEDGAIKTYADLTDAKWKENICIRSSSNIYNQSLLGSLIAHNGVEKAQDWANGVVANMARKPQGGDTDQIKAVVAGECDISVGNTYYLGKLAASDKAENQEIASKIRVVFPNQDTTGAHVNISGAAVTKSSKNTENAVKFIEFLASDEAQKIYADLIFEYPIRDSIEVSPVVKAWGEFKADEIALSEFAKYQADAVKVFDKAGWR